MIDIVQEGASSFPSITLFSTSGVSESALAVSDIDSATWSRVVVGTGEVVNSRSGVVLAIATIPFVLEQAPADNTRVDSTRRRERHKITVDYLYTRDAVAGKAGVFEMELLIEPADRVVYGRLGQNTRYLRKYKVGFDEDSDHLDWDEIWDIEEDATEYIEGRLGKRFWSSSKTVPRIIEKVGLLLGSAEVIDNKDTHNR